MDIGTLWKSLSVIVTIGLVGWQGNEYMDRTYATVAVSSAQHQEMREGIVLNRLERIEDRLELWAQRLEAQMLFLEDEFGARATQGPKAAREKYRDLEADLARTKDKLRRVREKIDQLSLVPHVD